jgi:transcriptional regulator with XRE-family HTH domain
MSPSQFVAARLRELRARHGLTQEQVAVLLGTDVKWYQRIELSAKDVRASTIDRLADVFGLSAVQFLAGKLPETNIRRTAPTAPHKPRKASNRKVAGE